MDLLAWRTRLYAVNKFCLTLHGSPVTSACSKEKLSHKARLSISAANIEHVCNQYFSLRNNTNLTPTVSKSCLHRICGFIFMEQRIWHSLVSARFHLVACVNLLLLLVEAFLQGFIPGFSALG